MKNLLRLTLLASVTTLVVSEAFAETLADAVSLAYTTNPVICAQRASQLALEETIVQAEAGFEPTLVVQGTVGTDTNTYPAGLSVPGQNVSAAGRSQTSNLVLTLNQALYTGGRVSSQVHAARAGVLAGREQLKATEESVLQAVVEVYSNVLRDQESLSVGKQSVALLDSELRDTRARAEAGEVTRTDVSQAEGRVAATRAQLSDLEAQLANSRAAYLADVGQSPGLLAPAPLLDPLLPVSLDKALATAEYNSPVLLQSMLAERASASRAAAARAQARPTISIEANVGYYGGHFGLASPFANYNRDVSALAVVTVPIFSGGLISSQVRQANETNNADRIAVEEARRQVTLNVTRAWNGLAGARARLGAQTEQVRAAAAAFEGSRLEAGAGLRTTLDVLISEQDLQAARIALSNAKGDVLTASAALLSAEGTLNVSDLSPRTLDGIESSGAKSVREQRAIVPLAYVVEGVDRLGEPTRSKVR